MTRIADLLAAGPTTSFEFFPPKTDAAAVQLEKAVQELAPLQPSFVSVTYGALGSTRDRTREVVTRINDDHPFPAMAHLTCVGHTRAEVVALLETYAAAGVHNVLALGGDPPADGRDPGGEFTHACELLELVQAVGGFSVGVAAHPELHPRSPDRVSDRRYLAEKLAAADFAVTQFFFDAAHYVELLDELAALGVDKPVIPGVLPVTNVAGLRRMAAMNGTDVPAALVTRLDAVADDPAAVAAIGVEVAVELCTALLAAGAPGLHLYTMNRSSSIRAVLAALGGGPPV
ncbi:MAG: methylenetetrahydrofolate reductase [Acidimicrobiia bacterium]|nr:methylenetetrahydrofolate reductase [Acidimicrobiia bacterium]